MPARLLTDAGEKFGYLTVIARARETELEHSHRLSRFRCRCKCGTTITVRSDALRDGSRRCCDDCKTEYRLRGIFTVATIGRGTTETHFAK
jgi:hypothetical protein